MYYKYLIVLLALLCISVWFAVPQLPDKNLHVIACDVGQGDAILIAYRNVQILVDGGPDNSAIDCLSRQMPFYDREIELVVLTHPQSDHYMGLLEVVDNYKVKTFLGNELGNSNQSYEVLKNKLDIEGGRFLVAKDDQDLTLDLIYLDILHPSDEFLAGHYDEETNNRGVLGEQTSNEDPNDFSVTFSLRYGNFTMLFTGDLSPEVSRQLANENVFGDIDVLKVPHHGSKNGLTEFLLEETQPEAAIISVGKNRWGHPHEGVLEILRTAGTEIYRTDERGDVEIVSDGEKYWVE